MDANNPITPSSSVAAPSAPPEPSLNAAELIEGLRHNASLGFELAQELGSRNLTPHLAAALLSPKQNTNAARSVDARRLRNESQHNAKAWQGWERNENPAMARLALLHAKRLGAAGSRSSYSSSYSADRPELVASAVAHSASRALARPDAARSGIASRALDLLIERIPSLHPYDFKPALHALGLLGDESLALRLINALPQKTAADPTWTPKQIHDAREAAPKHSPVQKFWLYGVQGAERSELSAFSQALGHASCLPRPTRGSDTPNPVFHFLLQGMEGCAFALAERGWHIGAAELAFGAARLDDPSWKRLHAQLDQVWLEDRRSSRDDMWTSRDGLIAIAALGDCIQRDDPKALSRLGARLPLAGKLLAAPKQRTSLGRWGEEASRSARTASFTLLSLSAFLGAHQCLRELMPAAALDKSRVSQNLRLHIPLLPPTAPSEQGALGDPLRAISLGDINSRMWDGAHLIPAALAPKLANQEYPESAMNRVELLEAALLSGSLDTVQLALELTPKPHEALPLAKARAASLWQLAGGAPESLAAFMDSAAAPTPKRGRSPKA